MFLEMQDFDFCQSPKPNQILPNLPKFYAIYPNFTQFCPNLPKKC